MQVVYYYDQDSGYCPVKSYLTPIASSIKLLSKIKAKIDYIAGNNGNVRAGFQSKLYGYESSEIRERKNRKVVIRILYFLHQDKMILLHAFEKPDNYHTKKKKNEIDKQYKIAEEYIKKYKSNIELSYEEYK